MTITRSTLARCLVVVLAASTSCNRPVVSRPGDEPEQAAGDLDGHQQMVALLDDIRVDALAQSNKYFAAAEANSLRQAIESLPTGTPPMERLVLMSKLGIRCLLMGDTQEAIQNLTAAYEMVPNLIEEFDAYPIRLPMLIGLAYLQQAETENCVECHTHQSCLFPIEAGGIHTFPAGARSAIPYFQEVLNRHPDDLTARWLLNLAYMLVGEHPQGVPSEHLIPAAVLRSTAEFPRFVDVAAELGVNTFSHCGGAVADDFDGDGWLDILVSTWSPAGQIELFRNGGDGTFQNVTEAANLVGLLGGLNLVQADYDNDGDTDVLVLRGAWLAENGGYPNSLLENDGHGRFRDVTFEAGLAEVSYPTQTASWADFDNDGDLDLYVGNEGYPSQLFRNDGQRRFVDVAPQAGVTNGGRAKGVIWGDYDNDRYPDIYVSNQGQPNRLYHNNQDGTFTDLAARAGVQQPLLGFPTWFWDFNNDGNLDLYAASYGALVEHLAADYLGVAHSAEPDRLYAGDGRGGFRDVTVEMNLTQPTAPMGSNFGDLDHDGYLDFYLGTGYPEYEQLMPNLMFHNREGRRFVDVTAAGGFGHLQKGHAVAFADFDHDGDQDVFIEMGGAYAGDAFWNALFKNPGFGNHSVTLKLVGQRSNRSAIGARIKVEVRQEAQTRSIYKWVNSGGSFGANPLRQQIGLGSAEQIDVIEIFWPTTGETQRFENLDVDRFYELTEGQARPRELDWRPISLPSPSEPPPLSARKESRS